MTRRANPKKKHTKKKLRIVVTPDPNASILRRGRDHPARDLLVAVEPDLIGPA